MLRNVYESLQLCAASFQTSELVHYIVPWKSNAAVAETFH